MEADPAAHAPPSASASGTATSLPILKALGDNTRYAIYLELARAPMPLATGDIAASLGLHSNTVRPHLERMREVGLVTYETHSHGVGRPQHRYSLAPDAPSLGLEPSTFPLLAAMLVRLAAQAGIGGDEAADIGRDQGRIDGQNLRQSTDSCLRALNKRLTSLGFDPAIVEGDAGPTVAFTHCPFAELAEAYPEVVCHLHRGLVEGVAEAFGDCEIGEFRTCIHRTPCQVDLVVEPVG